MENPALDYAIYEIPIEDFEADMNTESSKDKKEKILDLFINHNELKSEKEYIDIRFQLHYACSEGDIDLIKILLSETIEDDSKNYLIKIDKTNNTASFYGSNQEPHDFVIPRTIKHENNDYLITSVCGLQGDAFICDLLKINFEEESAVDTIYENALSYSIIEEISFPKSLINLKRGWCRGTEKLRRIIISPSNGQFIFQEDKYLFGKSNQNNDEFDKLLFVVRDIEEDVYIPSSVTQICEYAFYYFVNLRKVEIPKNSNLQIIGACAFIHSKIEKIFIPASVTKICKSAFCYCKNLRKVEIPTNSNLQTIEEYAFSYSKIEEIYFPESLIELKEGWCSDTEKLRRIIISPSNGQFIFKEDKYLIGKSNQNNDEFDKLLFVSRDIEEISIPASVTKICEGAFSKCENLRKVEIPTNSNLKMIEEYAFSNSKIEKIFIPASVTKICEGAFSGCENLRKVEIPTNSNLQTIEGEAFSYSIIEEIYFPKSLIELKEGWCKNTTKLSRIIISPSNGQFIFKEDKYLIGKSNQNNDEFDKLLFVSRDVKKVVSIPQNIKIIGPCSFQYSKIEEIFIPASVTKICEYAFSYCYELRKVEFPTNSNLQIIEKYAFSDSIIEEISIPQSLTKICERAFNDCGNLKKIEIPANSNLQTIEGEAFSDTIIEEIYFPKSLIELKEGWCETEKLKRIIISPLNGQFIFKEDKFLFGKSNQNNDEFDILLFVSRDIEEVSIPQNIKIIGSHSFNYSIIKEIFIPQSVTKICESAFSLCHDLKKVEIPTNSNLQIIEDFSFSFSTIEQIFIPQSVTRIYEDAFSFCDELQIVEISEESHLKSISRSSFKYKLKHILIMIPSSSREFIKMVDY